MKMSLLFAIFLMSLGNLIAAPASTVSYRGGEGGGGREGGGRQEGGGSYHGNEYHGNQYHGNEYRGQEGQTPYRGTENFDYGKSNVNATTIERHHDYNERQDANQWDDGGGYYVQPVYPSGSTGTYYPPTGATGATAPNPDAVQNNSSQWGN